MDKFTPNNVPGMVEIIEQQSLVLESQAIALKKEDIIVEFGSFFGLSTKCLCPVLIIINQS